jgi:hypothetical protein
MITVVEWKYHKRMSSHAQNRQWNEEAQNKRDISLSLDYKTNLVDPATQIKKNPFPSYDLLVSKHSHRRD